MIPSPSAPTRLLVDLPSAAARGRTGFASAATARPPLSTPFCSWLAPPGASRTQSASASPAAGEEREPATDEPTRGQVSNTAQVSPEEKIYIGRGIPAWGFGASVWGNPFKIKELGVKGVIEKLEAHVRGNAYLSSEPGSLKGKRLL